MDHDTVSTHGFSMQIPIPLSELERMALYLGRRIHLDDSCTRVVPPKQDNSGLSGLVILVASYNDGMSLNSIGNVSRRAGLHFRSQLRIFPIHTAMVLPILGVACDFRSGADDHDSAQSS